MSVTIDKSTPEGLAMALLDEGREADSILVRRLGLIAEAAVAFLGPHYTSAGRVDWSGDDEDRLAEAVRAYQEGGHNAR